MTEYEIAAAAQTCLNKALSDDRPFHRVSLFLDELRADPIWTDPDIIEVQTRVIRGLMGQMGSNE